MATSIDATTMIEAVLEAAFEVCLGSMVAADEGDPALTGSGAALVAAFRRAGGHPGWASAGEEALDPCVALLVAQRMLIGSARLDPGPGIAKAARRLLRHLVRRRVVLAPLGDRDDPVIILTSADAYLAMLECTRAGRLVPGPPSQGASPLTRAAATLRG